MSNIHSMPVETEKHKKSKRKIVFLLCSIITAAVLILTSGVTYARYIIGMNRDGGAGAALFTASGITTSSSKKLTLVYYNNVPAQYAFTLSNSPSGKVNEVTLDVDIIVQLPQALPEGIRITLNGKTAKQINADGEILTFDGCIFEACLAKTENFVLSFSGDYTKLDMNYDFNGIKITAFTEQTLTA